MKSSIPTHFFSRCVFATKLLTVMVAFPSTLFGFEEAATVVARVNGEPIYSSDLRQFENASQETHSAQEKAILFHLAVREARRKNLGETAPFKTQIDAILYRAFLSEQLKNPGTPNLTPTPEDLTREYEKKPLVRLHHLALLNQTPAQKTAASKTLKKIRSEIDRGVTFREFVLRYSQDPGARAGAELNFRGFHQLPPSFYEHATQLKNQQISEPFEQDNAIHLIQLIERMPFSEVPESYLSLLRTRLTEARERELLDRVLSDLRQRAKIEIVKNTEPFNGSPKDSHKGNTP